MTPLHRWLQKSVPFFLVTPCLTLIYALCISAFLAVPKSYETKEIMYINVER